MRAYIINIELSEHSKLHKVLDRVQNSKLKKINCLFQYKLN